jgi:hypothetical protein
VEGTTASGVETGHLAEVGVVLHCRSTKRIQVSGVFRHKMSLYPLQGLVSQKIGEMSSSCSIAIFFDHHT